MPSNKPILCYTATSVDKEEEVKKLMKALEPRQQPPAAAQKVEPASLIIFTMYFSNEFKSTIGHRKYQQRRLEATIDPQKLACEQLREELSAVKEIVLKMEFEEEDAFSVQLGQGGHLLALSD